LREGGPTVSKGAPTTIAAIAREAGVSVPTVSKVLNGRPDVSPATRARVEAAIERHQYRRRRTRTGSGARLIDLVIHELDFAWAVELIKGVEQVAAAGASASCSPSWAARTARRRSGSTTCSPARRSA